MTTTQIIEAMTSGRFTQSDRAAIRAAARSLRGKTPGRPRQCPHRDEDRRRHVVGGREYSVCRKCEKVTRLMGVTQ